MTKNFLLPSLSLLTLGFSLLCNALTSPSAPSVAYQSCGTYVTDIGIGESNPKDQASSYLNGALDELELMNPPSAADEQKRDACVTMSLQHGADPNNTKTYTAPLLMAITDKDLIAVQTLLKYKANPNVKDSAAVGAGTVPALQRACDSNNEDIAIALISAGADPSIGQTLWAASSDAEPRVVTAMLKTGKVPVNQLTIFSDEVDNSETALDASEYRLADLNQYFAQNKPNTSLSDKITAANQVLYGDYAMLPMIPQNGNPDAVMKDLLQRQTQVSSSLKAAGWSCHQPKCGVDDETTATDGTGSIQGP